MQDPFEFYAVGTVTLQLVPLLQTRNNLVIFKMIFFRFRLASMKEVVKLFLHVTWRNWGHFQLEVVLQSKAWIEIWSVSIWNHFKMKGKTEAATISTTTCMYLERVANFSYSLIFSMATTRKIISFLLKIKILWNRISSIFGDNSKISSVIKNCLFELFVKFLYIIEAILEIHTPSYPF